MKSFKDHIRDVHQNTSALIRKVDKVVFYKGHGHINLSLRTRTEQDEVLHYLASLDDLTYIENQGSSRNQEDIMMYERSDDPDYMVILWIPAPGESKKGSVSCEYLGD